MQMKPPRASGEAGRYCRQSNLGTELATGNLAWPETFLMIPDDRSAERWLWHRVRVMLTNGSGEALFHRQNLLNGDRVLVDLALVQAAAISGVLQVVLHRAKVLLILANGDHPSPWRQSSDQTEVRAHSWIFMLTLLVDSPPPSSPSLGGSPIVQRKKLTLLPRSEHPQEPLSTPVSAVDEVKPKSNPFGAARPVDTDSALKKVEEKLAKEKEHKDDSSVKGAAVTPAPSSPTGPRLDKGRQQPKQLLRRPSASPSAGNTGASRSEIDDVVAAKAEAPDEAISEAVDESWRKPETPVVAAPQEEDAGWETVPSRSKKINGVGARH